MNIPEFYLYSIGMKEEITIIGGGIAGLTTAIALHTIGKNPVIFEAAPYLKAVGAGLGLAANAIQAFARLGLKEEVIQRGRVLPSFTIYDQRGRKITETDSQAMSKKYGVDNFTIHRAALHDLLISKINPQHIHTDKQAVDITQTADSVTVTFQDGTTHETRLLIAADGIHSAIRRKLLPDAEPRYAGYTCWRAVIDNSDLNLKESLETWGTSGRFGIVPLAEKQVYWFACINAPRADPAMQHFGVADLQNHFKDFHAPIPTLLAHTQDKDLIWNDIIDLKPLERYVFNNILLIGDAAHATTPNMGQGACQAIEDAIVLADVLKSNADTKIALQQFEKRRLKRTHYITDTSWRVGKVAQIENRWGASLRNTAFRLLPRKVREKQFEKLYNVDF